jgi:ABC-2 type transport system ATP-binding protein
MADLILEVNDVVKVYGDYTALNKVNISIPKGSIYGLLGPNGAGKTTLMRIINQITAPDSGSVIFNGEKLQGKHISMIGYLPEERGLYKKMKVGEQALYLAQLKGMTYSEALSKLRYWFKRFKIIEWWPKKVEELSKGMAQKIQFIVTILHEPKLLIFDEPFSGFDPINASIIRDEIVNLRDKGTTIIFSTHRMESVEEICDHIALINNAETILEGSIENIKNKFDNKQFEVTINEDNLLESQEYTIVNQVHNVFNLTINDNFTQKDLIKSINEKHEIILLKKHTPSIEEIFIKAIGNE